MPDRNDADDLFFNRTPPPNRDQFFPRVVAESGHAGLQLSFGAIAVHEWWVTAPVMVRSRRPVRRAARRAGARPKVLRAAPRVSELRRAPIPRGRKPSIKLTIDSGTELGVYATLMQEHDRVEKLHLFGLIPPEDH